MDQQQPLTTSQQPYDTSMKEIFDEDAEDIIPYILPGATVVRVLDTEVLRPTMRADRAYLIRYRGKLHILHLEFQAGADSNIAYRLLVYHAGLLYDHHHPIISLIIYLFKDSVVEPPLKEMSGKEEILSFRYKVLKLWTEDARKYLEQRAVTMYVLLPAMANANASVVLQAIDELVEYYRDSETQLARRLLWLSTFLQRSGEVPLPDKKRVEERLDTLEQLLEENKYVRKQRALGREEGKVEGELLASRRMLANVVNKRFAGLRDLALQRVSQVMSVDQLEKAVEQIVVAPDEMVVRSILEGLGEK